MAGGASIKFVGSWRRGCSAVAGGRRGLGGQCRTRWLEQPEKGKEGRGTGKGKGKGKRERQGRGERPRTRASAEVRPAEKRPATGSRLWAGRRSGGRVRGRDAATTCGLRTAGVCRRRCAFRVWALGQVRRWPGRGGSRCRGSRFAVRRWGCSRSA
jgi:hypothetical protein